MSYVNFTAYGVKLWCYYTGKEYDDIEIESIFLDGDDSETDIMPIIAESVVEKAYNAAVQDLAELEQYRKDVILEMRYSDAE